MIPKTLPTLAAGTLFALLVGCAAGQPSTSAPPAQGTSGGPPPAPATSVGAGADGAEPQPLGPSMEVEQLHADAEQAGADLADTLAARTVDCGAASALRDRICDLAERICDIAERHPDDPEVVTSCDMGRNRCEEARELVDDAC